MSEKRLLGLGFPSGSAALPDPLAGAGAAAVEAGAESRRSGRYAPPVKAEGVRPPASQQAERAGGSEVLHCAESRSAGGSATAAAAKQPAESRQPRAVFLTQAQIEHLSFAALCQLDQLEDSYEADEPEMQEAIRSLTESRHLLGGRLS